MTDEEKLQKLLSRVEDVEVRLKRLELSKTDEPLPSFESYQSINRLSRTRQAELDAAKEMLKVMESDLHRSKARVQELLGLIASRDATIFSLREKLEAILNLVNRASFAAGQDGIQSERAGTVGENSDTLVQGFKRKHLVTLLAQRGLDPILLKIGNYDFKAYISQFNEGDSGTEVRLLVLEDG